MVDDLSARAEATAAVVEKALNDWGLELEAHIEAREQLKRKPRIGRLEMKKGQIDDAT